MKEIEEYIRYSTLFSYYKDLFTNRQKEYLSAYLEEDNSITEIAEAFNVSRQAVFDNIKRGCNQLDEYENRLFMLKRDEKILNRLLNLKNNFKMEILEKLIKDFEEGGLDV